MTQQQFRDLVRTTMRENGDLNYEAVADRLWQAIVQDPPNRTAGKLGHSTFVQNEAL